MDLKNKNCDKIKIGDICAVDIGGYWVTDESSLASIPVPTLNLVEVIGINYEGYTYGSRTTGPIAIVKSIYTDGRVDKMAIVWLFRENDVNSHLNDDFRDDVDAKTRITEIVERFKQYHTQKGSD